MNEQLYKKFREYIENNPTSLAFARLSEILFNAGRTDAAITLLEKGLEQNPAYLTAYNLLGDFYYKKGELEKAKQAYKRTIDLDPFNLNALANLLKIAVEQGNFAEAGARIFQILSIDPTNRAAYNYLTQYWDKIEAEFPDLTKEPEEEVPTIEIEDIGGTQFSLIGTNPIAEVKPLPVVVRTAPEEIKALDQLSEIPSMKPIELDEIEQGPLELFEVDEIFKAFEAPVKKKTAGEKPPPQITEEETKPEVEIPPAPEETPTAQKTQEIEAEPPREIEPETPEDLLIELEEEPEQIQIQQEKPAPVEPAPAETPPAEIPSDELEIDLDLEEQPEFPEKEEISPAEQTPPPEIPEEPEEELELDLGEEIFTVEEKQPQAEIETPPVSGEKPAEAPREEEIELDEDIFEIPGISTETEQAKETGETTEPARTESETPEKPAEQKTEPPEEAELVQPEKILETEKIFDVNEEEVIEQPVDIEQILETPPSSPETEAAPEEIEGIELPEKIFSPEGEEEIPAPPSVEKPVEESQPQEKPQKTESAEITEIEIPENVFGIPELEETAETAPAETETISAEEKSKPAEEEIAPQPEGKKSPQDIELSLNEVLKELQESEIIPSETPETAEEKPEEVVIEEPEPEKSPELSLEEVLNEIEQKGVFDFGATGTEKPEAETVQKTEPPAETVKKPETEEDTSPELSLEQVLKEIEEKGIFDFGAETREQPSTEAPSQPEPSAEVEKKTEQEPATPELSLEQVLKEIEEKGVFDFGGETADETTAESQPAVDKTPQTPEQPPAGEEIEIEPIEGLQVRQDTGLVPPEEIEELPDLQKRDEFVPLEDEEPIEIEGLEKRVDNPFEEIPEDLIEPLIKEPEEQPEARASEPEPPRQKPKDIITATTAEIYAAQGMTEKAIEIYEKILARPDLSPDDRAVYQRRVELLKQRLKQENS